MVRTKGPCGRRQQAIAVPVALVVLLVLGLLVALRPSRGNSSKRCWENSTAVLSVVVVVAITRIVHTATEQHRQIPA